MASPAVINVTKINASDIQFAEPRKNKNGGVTVGLKYNNQNVELRIPQVGFPGGLKVSQNTNKDGSVSTSYNLMASMTGGDPYNSQLSTDPSDTAKTYNFFHELEKQLIKTATDRSVAWFGKKRSEEVTAATFNKFITCSNDKTPDGWVPNGKYPPSLKIKLPVYDDKVFMEVIDQNENDVEVSIDSLQNIFTKGASGKLVLKAQVYITGQGFGLTLKPSFCQMITRKKMTAREAFRDDEDDSELVETEETEEQEENQVEVQMPEPTSTTEGAASSETAKPARRRKVA
jgi:hypothetical protein